MLNLWLLIWTGLCHIRAKSINESGDYQGLLI